MSTYNAPAVDSDSAAEIAGYIESFPALPVIVAYALQLRSDDDLSVVSLAHALEADPALTAKLLRAANSAYYGCVQRVYTVRDAITVIGFEAVRSLAITTAMVGGLWVDDELFNRQLFWRHSLRCGLFARQVALHTRYSKPDILFTLGVLHDVGRAAMIQTKPDLFRAALQQMQHHGLQLWRAERKIFGTDHAGVGARLASKWSFPAEYADAIAGHHDISASQSDPLLAQMLALADALAHAAARQNRQDYITPPLIHTLWEPLGLPEPAVRAIYDERDNIETRTRSLYETAVTS